MNKVQFKSKLKILDTNLIKLNDRVVRVWIGCMCKPGCICKYNL